ncbi:deoxyribodipyrimidine photo-lyase [Kocuria sp. cx-455]|uniref:cryptochrome/photolyase family protein n=1 Tax=Kocuria sp. cx-455 TaxID=2771377 RepID=UPI001685BFA6|nr:deoxyribodipyrimidine photo-lyase [Kocuria sp. cx-455]MBD2765913.1 deoxyribodipyrimidine photo-lyase [Kocuria sp. cx-455]
MTTVVWFRDDLRVTDHPALHHAVEGGEPVVCLYVLDEESQGIRPLGGAAKWWLHHSLTSLATDLADLGAPLTLRRGPAQEVVSDVVRAAGADTLLWNRRYGGPERAVDAALKEWAGENGVEAHSYAGSLLFEPWTITTQSGNPFKVFTPFWRACTSGPPPREPYPAPSALTPAEPAPDSENLADWHLLPTHPDWSGGFAQTWTVGEQAAHERLDDFLEERLPTYAKDRDYPAKPATSGLSPHLRWGEISPHTVWHTALHRGGNPGTFLTEIGWREFSWYNLYIHPDMAQRPINPKYEHFPWPELDEDALAAWQRGRTGIPLVDAGMHELWETGTMQNRVRMVVASLLAKNLLIDWRLGEQWFWDTLVDADAASNPHNWQWVAGCGTDAAPYFRIFNPETQQKRFDPDFVYVDRWNGRQEGVEPIVDLKESRAHALDLNSQL